MPTFNSDAGVAALTKMKEVVDGCMGAEGLTFSIDDSEIGMETRHAGLRPHLGQPRRQHGRSGKIRLRRRHGFAGSPAPNPDSGILGGSAWIDAYSITKRSGVDPDLALAVMETDFDQVARAIVRTGVPKLHGGRNLPAMAVSLGQGVGSSLNPDR